VTGVHGRTFGVWTLLSCTLCFLCAFNLGNRPLYAATLMSFVYAYAHFILEDLVYHTFTAANLGSFALVAGTTYCVLLLLPRPVGRRSFTSCPRGKMTDRSFGYAACCSGTPTLPVLLPSGPVSFSYLLYLDTSLGLCRPYR
jgi:hypothetical protein